jgi:hypothetical protein
MGCKTQIRFLNAVVASRPLEAAQMNSYFMMKNCPETFCVSPAYREVKEVGGDWSGFSDLRMRYRDE